MLGLSICLSIYLSTYLSISTAGEYQETTLIRFGCSADFHDWIAINPRFAFEEDHNDGISAVFGPLLLNPIPLTLNTP
jgi:hypothetical protein